MSADIISMLRCVVKQIGLCKRGYPLNIISPHSLRSGGAMALKLGNIDIIRIKKYGCWSLDTFLEYIHKEISALCVNVSKTMATPHNAFNVAAI